MLQNTRQSQKKRVPKAGTHVREAEMCIQYCMAPPPLRENFTHAGLQHHTHTLSLLSCSPHIDFAFIVAAGHLRSAVTASQEGPRFRAHFGNPGYRYHMGEAQSQSDSDLVLKLLVNRTGIGREGVRGKRGQKVLYA